MEYKKTSVSLFFREKVGCEKKRIPECIALWNERMFGTANGQNGAFSLTFAHSCRTAVLGSGQMKPISVAFENYISRDIEPVNHKSVNGARRRKQRICSNSWAPKSILSDHSSFAVGFACFLSSEICTQPCSPFAIALIVIDTFFR